MYLRNLILIALIIIVSESGFGQTNVWVGGGGDNLWTNAANWSLGHTPTPTESVEIGNIFSVIIPSGSNISIYELQSSADPLRIQSGAVLNIEYYLNHLVGGRLINNGEINITDANNQGINLFGTFVNNGDLDLFNSSTDALVVRESQLVNNGRIDIIGAGSSAIFMGNVPVIGHARKITNNETGIINLDDIDNHAIFLNDTIVNHGTILINDINRNLFNVPAHGLYIDVDGYLDNHGIMNFTFVDDDGIANYNKLNNLAGGQIFISNYDRYGIYNDAFFFNYGYIEVAGSLSSDGDPGIYLDNRFDNEPGGEVVIDGNYFIDDGIDCNLGTFYNKSGAGLEVKQVTNLALRVDGGNFDNDGSISISDITETFARGIDCSTNFWNDGMISMNDITGGILTDGFSFDNNGSIIMTNVKGTALFPQDNFHNTANGIIEISGVPGETVIVGITTLDGAPGYNPFINDGSIDIKNTAIAVDQRDGTFENNGSLSISDSDFGINQNGFFDPPIFENAGSIEIRDLTSGTFAIHVEEGDPNTFNFNNQSTGNITIENTFRGIDASSGVQNLGLITMNNISDRAFYINGVGISAEVNNGASGTISVDNALNGIYFDGTLLGEINLMPFNNDGTVIMNNITGELITGDDSNEKFNNNNAVYLDGHLDCTWMDLENTVGVGDSIGKLEISNYSAINPTYRLDLTGNGVDKTFNNLDSVTFDAAVTIGGELIVDRIPGFIPEIGDEYTLFSSNVSISGSFSSTTLPNLPSNMEWSLNYLSDKITISIHPNQKEWMGTVNNSWNNPNNWEGGIIPSKIDDVVIPSGTTFLPQIRSGVLTVGFTNPNTTHTCNSLVIEDGASMILDSTTKLRNQNLIEIHGVLRIMDDSGNAFLNRVNGEIIVGSSGSLIIKP